MISQLFRVFALCTSLFVIPISHTLAATITGKVVDRIGQAISGVQLTLTRNDGLYAETVYSNKKGEFVLRSKQNNVSQIRARRIGYADATQSIDLNNTTPPVLIFTLRKLTTPREISDNLTASAHFTRVKLDDPKAQKFFRVECLTCHQLGSTYTRMPRPKERWEQIIERMLGFYGVKNEKSVAQYAETLSKAFDGTPLNIKQKQIDDPVLTSAHITQWKLPGALIAHDVEHHAADDKFYTVDQGTDKIYITDPRSNTSEVFNIPDDGIPIGGKFFRELNQRNPFSLNVSRGPHSLQEGPDEKFYTTDTVSGQIGVFDPKTHQYEGYDIGGKALYPHTIRFDNKGKAWFTLAVSNQVGRFDPQTKEMRRVDLPTTSSRPQFPVSLPYGIDIHPVDGSVWYSRLMADRIGRVDPDTMEVKEFAPPLVGPRRMRFAKDGTLWIPAYGSGTLVKLDTKIMQYKEYKFPPLSPGELEAPYAVGVHPKSQEVWVTANMSDRIFRFLPEEERFISYPLPTKGIFLRDIIFTPDGRVCAASSTAAPALTLEGGMEEVICIAPDYYSKS